MIPTAQDILRNCRLKSGKTYREVSTKAGVPLASLFKWEKGETEPRFCAVCYCLDVMGYEIEVKEKGAR